MTKRSAAVLLLALLAACAKPRADESIRADAPDAAVPSGGAGAPGGAVRCTGMLPHICVHCPDGTMGCAHWVIRDGGCAMESCSGNP